MSTSSPEPDLVKITITVPRAVANQLERLATAAGLSRAKLTVELLIRAVSLAGTVSRLIKKPVAKK